MILYVEVKGTTTAGESVLLTPNEVAFARSHAGRMELFLVHGIVLEQTRAGVRAVGGVERVLPQWGVDVGVLAPALYRYTLPTALR